MVFNQFLSDFWDVIGKEVGKYITQVYAIGNVSFDLVKT